MPTQDCYDIFHTAYAAAAADDNDNDDDDDDDFDDLVSAVERHFASVTLHNILRERLGKQLSFIACTENVNLL